jgi:hypothetical protein
LSKRLIASSELVGRVTVTLRDAASMVEGSISVRRLDSGNGLTVSSLKKRDIVGGGNFGYSTVKSSMVRRPKGVNNIMRVCNMRYLMSPESPSKCFLVEYTALATTIR